MKKTRRGRATCPFQNSRRCTTMIDAHSNSHAANKLANIPSHGRCPETRKVIVSTEKAPVTNRRLLSQSGRYASDRIVGRRIAPKATEGAVYSPDTSDETNTATARYTNPPPINSRR